jgi:hypothetical protein
LASDPDRLIGPEGYAEQGTEEGISTNEDECYRKKEKKYYCVELHNFCCFIAYCWED